MQVEYATDVVFRQQAKFQLLYAAIVRTPVHAVKTVAQRRIAPPAALSRSLVASRLRLLDFVSRASSALHSPLFCRGRGCARIGVLSLRGSTVDDCA
jgi:hypothetical protein